MEILKRYGKKKVTLWIGRDAEGKKAYEITDDLFGGVAFQPSTLASYSQKAAWDNYAYFKSMDERYRNSRI